MEYSVNDLIRILLKKWYVILLAMCLLGGLSTITARRSYARAVAQYEQYTAGTPSAVPETGTSIASYQYDFTVTDLSRYTAQAKTKDAFLQQFFAEYEAEDAAPSERSGAYAAAEQAYKEAVSDCKELLMNDAVMEKTQAEATQRQLQEPDTVDEDGVLQKSTGALCVADHLSVSQTSSNTFQLKMTGLEDSVAQVLFSSYLRNLQEVGGSTYSMELTLTELSREFTPDPVPPDLSAQFSQTVMQKPQQAPILVKTVGTAMAFAFVLACFLVLLYTFVKDSRTAARKNRV